MERKLPRHIAIIMDGNGRWATSRGMPRVLGHRVGAETVSKIVQACTDMGLEALTLYAFSWENWNRPQEEINDLMELLEEFLRREFNMLKAKQVRLRAIGRLESLPARPLSYLKYVMAETAPFTHMTLTLALSYGGRQEIIDAVRRVAVMVKEGCVTPEQVDEALFAQQLYTADIPDPDLLIRTSGEQRLSNFLLWQTSYTELYVTPKLWPDFSKDDLREAIAEFERRDRRFGAAGNGAPIADTASARALRAAESGALRGAGQRGGR
jgi:undecaprenyl diphosphate synthase